LWGSIETSTQKVICFQTAYDIAKQTKDAFNQMALPRFFQCAPSVGVTDCKERGTLSSEVSNSRNNTYCVA